MAKERQELRLGKGTTFFVKSQLKYLPQEDETWEADFRAMPKPITQSATHYVGMVLVPPHGEILAMFEIDHSPTVNDLATLLANAMRRPLIFSSHRPMQIQLRGNPRWNELSPHLNDLGIEVTIKPELPLVVEAFGEFLAQVKKSRSVGKVKANAKQAKVEKEFPAIAKWVQSYGHIEIGDQEGFGFIVRAIDYGGQVFVDDKPDTLAEAMASLEAGLARWFEEQER